MPDRPTLWREATKAELASRYEEVRFPDWPMVPVEPAGTAEVYRFSEINVTNIEFDNVPDGMYWLVPVDEEVRT
jgi:hypothetical protein